MKKEMIEDRNVCKWRLIKERWIFNASPTKFVRSVFHFPLHAEYWFLCDSRTFLFLCAHVTLQEFHVNAGLSFPFNVNNFFHRLLGRSIDMHVIALQRSLVRLCWWGFSVFEKKKNLLIIIGVNGDPIVAEIWWGHREKNKNVFGSQNSKKQCFVFSKN